MAVLSWAKALPIPDQESGILRERHSLRRWHTDVLGSVLVAPHRAAPSPSEPLGMVCSPSDVGQQPYILFPLHSTKFCLLGGQVVGVQKNKENKK